MLPLNQGWFDFFYPFQIDNLLSVCSFTTSATLNGTTYNYPMTFTNRSASNAYEITIHNGPVAQPITWGGGWPPTIQFTQVHLEATSRGVGNNWAIINCQ